MLNELEKEIRDFIKKYTYQMKRFNIKLVEKALRVIKKSKSEELITEIDIHSIISYLEKEITAIESESSLFLSHRKFFNYTSYEV